MRGILFFVIITRAIDTIETIAAVRNIKLYAIEDGNVPIIPPQMTTDYKCRNDGKDHIVKNVRYGFLFCFYQSIYNFCIL
jgi:hypothetical protein